MIEKFLFEKMFKNFLFLFLFFIFFTLIFLFNFQTVNVLAMDYNQNQKVTEELRIKVPSNLKVIWLKAEKEVWEPWLANQEGFLGREIFWNKENEEALILVNWENKKLWKNISIKEINKIQNDFENNVKTSLNVIKNPFPITYAGELYHQK